MNTEPETRHSLIGRLGDLNDRQAWDEFTAIYRPLIFKLAKQSGLQDSDADDAVQEVMWAVGRAVTKWRPDPARARFRTWLSRITRNLVINILVKQKRQPWRLGDSNLQELLYQQPSRDSVLESDLFRESFRRQAFHLAAAEVQRRVQARTWLAFQRTAIEGAAVSDVAEELDLDVGMIYVARSRVMRLLREEVEAIEFDLIENDDAEDIL